MARSYKKHPFVKDDNSARKFFKRQANKKVRKNLDIDSGCKFKRLYNSYNIVEYSFHCSFLNWERRSKISAGRKIEPWSKSFMVLFFNRDLWERHYHRK